MEAKVAKHGPWFNCLLVLAAVYGPRALVLWKMWETERANRKKRVISVMPMRSESEPAATPDSSEKVN